MNFYRISRFESVHFLKNSFIAKEVKKMELMNVDKLVRLIYYVKGIVIKNCQTFAFLVSTTNQTFLVAKNPNVIINFLEHMNFIGFL